MKKYNGIMFTNAINKYNENIPMKTMLELYRMQWNDLVPMYANHNHTIPIGLSKMCGLCIVPDCAYSMSESYLPENKLENENVTKISNDLFINKYIKEHEDLFNNLISKVESYIIGKYEKYVINGGFIYNKDIVKRMFPKLCEKMDKDGLIDLNELNPVFPGIYSIGEFVIFAHKYFRRNYSYLNTLNTHFLKSLEKLDKSCLSLKIAIDFDIIGLVKDQKEAREYQYWWGPKFNNSLNDIPYGVARYENTKFNYLLSPYKSTEFGWYSQDDKHTFECEELVEDVNLIEDDEYFACRFVHSMVNNDNQPCHLDGAVRIYSLDKYIERKEITFDKFGRDSIYVKLWRVDKPLSVDLWKELISNYYRDNMLIGEYFNGKDENVCEAFKNDNETKISNFNYFTPCELNEKDGVMCFFSFKEKGNIKYDYNIEIVPTYVADDKLCEEKIACMINKALRTQKIKIYDPAIGYINFNDRIYNLPLYKCKSFTEANIILDVIKEFISQTSGNGNNFLLTFGVQINIDEEKDVVVSFAGENTSYYKMFNSQKFKFFPKNGAQIEEWLANFYELITELFDKNKVDIINFVNEDLLTIKRTRISNKDIDEIINNESSINIKVKLDEDKMEFVKQNTISETVAFFERKVKCPYCGEDYYVCECISSENDAIYFLDEDVKVIGYFWTSRKI